MNLNIFSKVKSMFSSQMNSLTNITSKLSQLTSKAEQAARKFIKETTDILMKKPSEKDDYVKVGRFYISKRFLVISGAVAVAFIVILIKFVYPWADGRIWYANLRINSQKYQSFTGKAKVRDNNKNLIYKGKMESGKITGYGIQYDIKGNIVYIGNFEDSQYSGVGELYNNSVIVYKGNFAQNLYDGQGELYSSASKLIYNGAFSLGQKSGKGIEYNEENGLRKYYGDFAKDLREGSGSLYENDGKTVLYEGSFLAGKYSGDGKLYQNGVLKYQGAFANDLYEGDGTLYDVSTKKILYQGAFTNGLYEGEGTLYDPVTSKVIYSGEFTAGQRQGAGESYDKLGTVNFNGDFKNDNIDYLSYLGKSADDITEQFGKENYRKEVSNHLILTYTGLDASIIFEPDTEKSSYVCKKIVMGVKDTFMGLNAKSSKSEIESVMGKAFSSLDYKFDTYYNTVFSQLSINLSSKNSAKSDKFIMGNYFIRFYYNSSKTEILSIEICSI